MSKHNFSTIGVVGQGAFGQLLTELFAPHAKVSVFDADSAITGPGIKSASIDEVASAHVVIIATSLDGIEDVCKQLAPHVTPETIVMDVCSVKVRPAEIMQRVLGDKCRLLATHPLFGPQSVSENGGTQGFKIVWHSVSGHDFVELEQLLVDTLGVEIIRMTPEAHDKEMAWVHGLTFFVGRALMNMNPPHSKLATHYYQKLLDLVDLEQKHSIALFNTIQRGNPYAEQIRQQYLASAQLLESTIQGANNEV